MLALADMIAILQKYGPGFSGSTSSVYTERVDAFLKAVTKYQTALMNYREATKINSTTKVLTKEMARTAFRDLQVRFRHALDSTTKHLKSRKGTPLTNVQRGLNIAKDSRKATKLNLTNQVQASKLVMLSKQMKHLGYGLAAIDIGFRVGNIHNSYRAGGNWERDLFRESLSLGISAITGAAIIKTGTAALLFFAAPMSLGLTGIILCSVAIAGAAAGGSMFMDNLLRNKSEALYDNIMSAISL